MTYPSVDPRNFVTQLTVGGGVNTPSLDLSSYTRLERNSRGYSHIFGVKLSNEINGNALRPNRKWEIQYVGHQNGSTYISALRPVKNAVSMAKPMFSGFHNSMEPNTMLYDRTGSGKSYMAATKTEVFISYI